MEKKLCRPCDIYHERCQCPKCCAYRKKAEIAEEQMRRED